MDLRAAKALVALRSAISRDQRAEAYVTAWMTAVLAHCGLLFHSFKPQALCVSRGGIGAGEYDFVRLDPNGIGVVLEIKPAYFTGRDLERALMDQALNYAFSDRRFAKGMVIVTNGFEFVWSSAYCPTKKSALAVAGAQGIERIDRPESLLTFVTKFLAPSEAFIDSKLVGCYRAPDLLRNVQVCSAGGQTALWRDILDVVRDTNGWSVRKQEATLTVLRNLAIDVRKFSQFREVGVAKAIYQVLRRPDHWSRSVKNIESQYGKLFPSEAALRNALADFRQCLPG